MNFYKKIVFLLFLLGCSILHAQTAGLNYQALILNNQPIEIPGTNVSENQLPLGLEEVVFRFSISNEDEIEYTEVQKVITDENGMVSLIVGEGTPMDGTFSDVVWDGKPKFLNVELNILSDNDGFNFLDTQKILYLPTSGNGISANVISGLHKDGKFIKLGGSLIEPTNIDTDIVNTLAIKGLQDSASDQDQVIVSDGDSEILKRRSLSSIIQKEQVVLTALEGQTVFKTPLPISSIGKLDVYRNGIRIEFIKIDDNSIALESEVICFKGDEIRIVQVN